LIMALLSSLVSAITGSRAARQQAAAAEQGIEEQRRLYDEIRQSFQPFLSAGTGAIGGFVPYQQAGLQAFQQQQALGGLQGQPAQQQAISALEQSPLYQSLAKQGEEALLQRASATGGLRGGNIQAALAQFRPAMLQQLIDQQYARLGGLAGTGLGVTERLATLGQASAGLQGQLGSASTANIGELLGQRGAAQAGGTLAVGGAINRPLQFGERMAGQLFGMGM
jgi:hypothetical protein